MSSSQADQAAPSRQDVSKQAKGASAPETTAVPSAMAAESGSSEPPSSTPEERQQNGAGEPCPPRSGDPEKKPPRHKTDELKGKIVDKKQKIKTQTKPAGGFDTTPLPAFPPGYTVKFTFHRATNLPAADIHNASADPYLTATLTAAVPKRHKEDPIMVYRTRTLRATTKPEWEEEWIVANVPRSGFRLKCRLYDEDYPDHDDRLGNVTFSARYLDEKWEGYDHKNFDVKKRMASKRAYIFKAATSSLNKNVSMTPHLELSVEVIGRSDPPGAQMHTVGPTTWIQHFSPMIGRLTGIKVNKQGQDDAASTKSEGKKTNKYDFQANEMQLQGPVPTKLYHRYVEFRPVIGRMFTSSGLRGRILNKALHKQHRRIYNFDSSTEVGTFKPRSEEAAIQFLKLAHFDEGGRIFTYVLTLDGLLRFTETGKEFGIDLLSKHTMHSDVATYIACSGEFFIRRLKKPTADESPEPSQPTHPSQPLSGGPPDDAPPEDPSYYQLIIDNDSGTYRPDKSILPDLKAFLEANFPGLGVVVMHCADDELSQMKKEQAATKKKERTTVNMVLNRSPSSSSFSSSDESRLGDLDDNDGERPSRKTKREIAWDVLENPNRIKEIGGSISHNDRASGGGAMTVK